MKDHPSHHSLRTALDTAGVQLAAVFPQRSSGYCPRAPLHPCSFQVLQLLLLFVLRDEGRDQSLNCMFSLQGTNKESIIAFTWLAFHEIIKKTSLVLENLGGNPKYRGSDVTLLGHCLSQLGDSVQLKVRALLTMAKFLGSGDGFSPLPRFEVVRDVQKETVPLSCQ